MNFKKIKRKLLISVIVTGMSAGFVIAANATFSEPGSTNDPLVTLSFVEQRLEQIKFYVNSKIEEVNGNITNNKTEIDTLKTENSELKGKIEQLQNQSGSAGSNLEVVTLEKGKMLVCDAGAEIILRAGQAQAIASELGGLSDVTGGQDIPMGKAITPNHLLIVPRSDGRGVYAVETAILMVRGSYRIQ
ncbi:MAG: hypothetical protein FH761_12470 [Firmicutes bacterium]|nr:hypothetical protein [Bacillota bacterium]